MRFANNCILFLFTFYTQSQLFWTWSCTLNRLTLYSEKLWGSVTCAAKAGGFAEMQDLENKGDVIG